MGTVTRAEANRLMAAEGAELAELMHAAALLRESHHGRTVTYSRKVFIPLTTLCRDDCGYCTFKRDPGQPGAKTLSPDEVLDIARRGREQGCKEALFSLGDKPELRFPEAAEALARHGYKTTAEYLVAMCRLVLDETGLLPHANPGTLGRKEMARLRECNASMGIMLENLTPRLRHAGMAHEHAPDKAPGARLAMLRHAGELRFPFTTGLLIGIGETPAERVDTLFAIRELHERYGHIQEVIVQNFRAKAGIPMAAWPSATLTDLLRTTAVARLVLGATMNLQAPPNLTPDAYPLLLLAGINDWGGVSPVTPDHINPEAPWPEIELLARRSAEVGYSLRERLTVYPEFISRKAGFVPEPLQAAVARLADAEGYAIPYEKIPERIPAKSR
ncbi:MAG: 7,8-didemethyl-8-hydroxy-5-deazariboflavin synthase CofG [bacterium]